ncbi:MULTISPECIES: phosphoenolpyruvate--protein phosphotransferase [unclassified Haloferax]|uniref:phosphoenolpyruvate--protein phosphotransferase n=1 Tax=unclassified Haloferax TaxID=2625095 RepID=UPI0002B08D06|nr:MULTISPECIES: phosphoenolpyruvate--protein phosphotransferase [unclassified Haloferax]ELZ56343.1 phosphoenolpyruvate-protein phosphotransferase [Haloferax sp. ATCC BAA-646]ELZ67688.1 phosphoenolpyruvate-protein phosphotransferase [Haloferax sp. ATCC BAA-645]ELZ68259.1 phosphoenolpyruvate-protein phosphotransferase [Haloferax sp. ATCC BAA-644]
MSDRRISGVGVTPLLGVGTVVQYDSTVDLDESERSAADPETELQRFEAARETAADELARERSRTAERVGAEEAEIFDAHLQFLDDPQITDGVETAVGEDGVTAGRAVSRAFEDPIATFEGADGMFAERADDLRDVRDRLLRILLDRERVDLSALPEGTVLVAERLTPSDTAQLDPDAVAGFVTVEGGRTSHAAIMARSLAIPAVVGVAPDALDLTDGTRLVVDGTTGDVTVDPDANAVAAARESSGSTVRHDPVATADGRQVEVAANVGTPREAVAAAERGADGVGLFRTEFLFLDRATPPDEDEQYEALDEVCETFAGSRVVVRTLDIGGDKPIPYVDSDPGDNPFLGVRGVRFAPGERPELFEEHVRAILRAAAGPAQLAVMFPLVSTVTELDALLDEVSAIAAELDDEGIDCAVPELGAMVETPASVFVAREFAERLDFLSIGTNDLTQYVMAAARDDDRVASLHDPLHPPVLRAIARTVEAAHEGNAWVGMCGEMAGDPDLTELLVGLGLDELSMSAVTIPDVKAGVRNIDDESAAALAEAALSAETREDVRALVD